MSQLFCLSQFSISLYQLNLSEIIHSVSLLKEDLHRMQWRYPWIQVATFIHSLF